MKKFKSNNPYEIARGLNIIIYHADLGRSTKGMYYRKMRRRCIVIQNDLDENWQRMVCAHELAHDQLHPGLNRFWLDQNAFFNTGKYDRQANIFALKLLTHGIDQYIEESVSHYYSRCGIPLELHKLFIQ
ncbi:ImmA/IrrE family metallo-endopeptidase [Paenibacillus kribbensis]|uniref:ImmA/IrrE family metallo-endopeptidase n=1 Tax=Paenibacillus kribbensis TaxID=172713 RepID=UPI002DB80696|nr:ImmA/IrrE family metallo-endopeptidase [Paenibacillus kribbensis]